MRGAASGNGGSRRALFCRPRMWAGTGIVSAPEQKHAAIRKCGLCDEGMGAGAVRPN